MICQEHLDMIVVVTCECTSWGLKHWHVSEDSLTCMISTFMPVQYTQWHTWSWHYVILWWPLWQDMSISLLSRSRMRRTSSCRMMPSSTVRLSQCFQWSPNMCETSLMSSFEPYNINCSVTCRSWLLLWLFWEVVLVMLYRWKGCNVISNGISVQVNDE